ncbi:hypothetical protein F0P96_07915 [Hymenobacter busanensis]|uniref:Uncharacterized protein n=1 Tax=Hymenobacter busanensis TaxID=2607656 RepID=A0A7L5A3G8_9BACT|nr:hypothetical protein [Hymenobacter busanensis]KAA9332906.1 hypothetical protein F0P96_07915 [Hymenobacter busanensis]QHJ08420.1 hypothetical protein GUY19_14415 [Hymenobacter busanensis]
MSELHNPLFDDEREFLERQKLEYERALLGDVDHLKDQTTRVGKYVAIGAAILGGFWIVSKVLSSHDDEDDYDELPRPKKGKKVRRKARLAAQSDDYGFGGGEHPRAQLAPDVYHATPAADADPFPAFDAGGQSSAVVPVTHYQQKRTGYQRPEPQNSLVWDTLKAFADSDAGKMLIGQVTGVLIALITRKVNDLMEVNKNSDLAASATEPETKDIDFVIHHDDAHAPNPPA